MVAQLVAVLTALGDAELHVVLGQHGLVRLAVGRARIAQGRRDLVAQGPLEPVDLVLLTLQ